VPRTTSARWLESDQSASLVGIQKDFLLDNQKDEMVLAMRGEAIGCQGQSSHSETLAPGRQRLITRRLWTDKSRPTSGSALFDRFILKCGGPRQNLA
jgi:hypothetical protein